MSHIPNPLYLFDIEVGEEMNVGQYGHGAHSLFRAHPNLGTFVSSPFLITKCAG